MSKLQLRSHSSLIIKRQADTDLELRCVAFVVRVRTSYDVCPDDMHTQGITYWAGNRFSSLPQLVTSGSWACGWDSTLTQGSSVNDDHFNLFIVEH